MRKRILVGLVFIAVLAVSAPLVATPPPPQVTLQFGHSNVWLRALATSPRGDFYATGDFNGVVKVWTREHQVLHTFWESVGDVVVSNEVTELKFSADGRLLMAHFAPGGNLSGYMCVWSLPDGKKLKAAPEILARADQTTQAWPAAFEAYSKTHSALSPNRQFKAQVIERGTQKYRSPVLQISENATEKIVRTFDMPPGFGPLAWSSDTKLIGVQNSSPAFTTLEFDVPSGTKRSFELPGSRPGVSAWSWSPDGRFLSDGSAALWDLQRGAPCPQIAGEVPRFWNISAFGWTPDGKTMITNQLQSWRMPSLQRGPRCAEPVSEWVPNASTASRLRGRLTALAACPDNRRVLVGTQNELHATAGWDHGANGMLACWDMATGEITVLLRTIDVGAIRMAPDGRHFALRLSGGEWTNSRAEISVLLGSPQFVRNGWTEVWDSKTLSCVAAAPEAFSAWLDNRRLCLETRNNQSFSTTYGHSAWDFASGKCKPYESTWRRYWLDNEAGYDVMVCPDGRIFDWASDWPGSTLSPTGRLVATASAEGGIDLYRMAPTTKFKTPDGKTRQQNIVRYAATMTTFASMQPDGSPDWLVWTPGGAFDGSLGGIAQLRWRQNGKVLPANAFPKLRRPGLLRQLTK